MIRICFSEKSAYVHISTHMGPKHASKEKILSMVIFLIFVQKNVYRNRFQEAKIPLNLTSEGQKYPPEVRVQHETCSTICGTPVQAILDQKNLTGSAGGAREGQNMAHLGHFNGPCAPMHYFDLP